MGETLKTPKVVLTSDNCCGQNKNLSVNAILHMKDRPEITSIEQKFLEPGHTHMECDADHGKIEKKQKKTTNPISHPYDWRALVRSCGFTIFNMTCEHFLDFDAYSKNSFPCDGHKSVCFVERYSSDQI
jgi:hypothetical protein